MTVLCQCLCQKPVLAEGLETNLIDESNLTMTNAATRKALASLPSIDRLLGRAEVGTLVERYGRSMVIDVLRKSVSDTRRVLLTETDALSGCDDISTRVVKQAQELCEEQMTASLRPVINLTGTVLHTNLGRAPLPEVCIERIAAVARGASNLEFDLDRGRRGDRDSHVERWIQRHTGAEAATIVNNNAAAVLLTLSSLAYDQAVAVSRGELVEIGGSFRIPDVMSRAGCKLAEVGTTNRTHGPDYIKAIECGAVAVMKVHTSNYAIEGFTASVDESTLSEIARAHSVVSISDLGSGCLVDLSSWGLPREQTVREVVETGIDVVTFSGDKLLGGPQCGVIAGKREIIDRIRKNPMKRALRCDKMTLAALEAVLELYADPEKMMHTVPALRLLTRPQAEIQALAERVLPTLEKVLGKQHHLKLIDCASQIGSGAVPVDTLPSVAICITPQSSSGAAVNELAARFRSLPRPVVGRVHEGALWFDLRCLVDESDFVSGLNALTDNSN